MEGQSPSHHTLRRYLPLQEETGPDNTKSVLKAIMLLRRSRGSIEKENDNRTDFRETSKGDPKGCKNGTDALLKSREKHPIPGQRNRKFENRPTPSVDTIPETTSSETREINLNESFSFTDSRQDSTRHSKPRLHEEHWVTNDKKFVAKEVVNTRIPGKSYSPPPTYRRFEPSMFENFDKINSLHTDNPLDSSGAKISEITWLKKVKESLCTGQNDYNPGPSPVIVIEEYCEKDDAHGADESNEETDDKSYTNKGSAEPKVPPGSLETLIEDIDTERKAENADEDE